MTVQVLAVRLVCNVCGVPGPEGVTSDCTTVEAAVSELERRVKGQGWYVEGPAHVCAGCVEKIHTDYMTLTVKRG